MKKVLFVPGFRDDLTTHNYSKTLTAIREKGYDPELMSISWTRTTIDDWAKTLENRYKELNPDNTILAGFSFGAVTAFAVAAEKNPSELWLFSMSAAFSEDMVAEWKSKSWLREVGKNRTYAFDKLSFDRLATKINCKTLLFIGEKEARAYPNLKDRVGQAAKKIPSSFLINIPKTHHDVTEEGYIEAIKANI